MPSAKKQDVENSRINVQVYLPYTTRKSIKERAERVGKSVSGYLRAVLTLLYSPELSMDKLVKDE